MLRRLAIVVALLTAALAIAFYLCPSRVYSAGREVYFLFTGVRHAYTRVGGHRIHYLVTGEGPPLVLVHGIASRAADAAPLFRALGKHHRVYALDLLGYGDSDQPSRSDLSIPTQSEVVRGFMDRLHLEKPDVLGISLGGWITLKLAADHPERVRRLILVSSAGVGFETTLHERSFSSDTLDELRQSLALQTDRAPLLPEFVLRDFLRHGQGKRWIVRRSMRDALSGRHLLDRKLQRVRMPVLLVWGTNDRIIPFTVARTMQREIPHAKLVALKGCGHLAVVECRGDVLPAVQAFLAR